MELAGLQCSVEECPKFITKHNKSGKCTEHSVSEYQRQYRADNAQRLAEARILRSGVRSGEAKAIREAAGQCELCGGLPDALDHNHTTGKTRGVLCHWCNTRVGMLEDANFASWHPLAVAYLDRHS